MMDTKYLRLLYLFLKYHGVWTEFKKRRHHGRHNEHPKDHIVYAFPWKDEEFEKWYGIHNGWINLINTIDK